MSYSVSHKEWCGRNLLLLTGPDGAKAAIAAWCGGNLVELALPAAAGQQAVDLIDAPPDAASLLAMPTRSGSPVLFPFPGRVAESRFTYRGRTYELGAMPDGSPARHGFMLTREFTEVATGESGSEAFATIACDVNDAEILAQYPSAFRLELTFRLRANQLLLQVAATNTGDGPLPCAFGWHPYFLLPVAGAGKREDCRLLVPAASKLVLQNLVPAGRKAPVTAETDLRQAPRLGAAMFDDVFTDVAKEPGNRTTAAVECAAAGLKLSVSAGPSFGTWVIYTPPQRGAICLEPYTAVGNSLNMADSAAAGLMELAPGQKWTDDVSITLAAL